MSDNERAYHHGTLKRALVDAAVALIEEGGIEHVSVREAAKRVGVSPGAPFRHFPSKTALLTAVAEEAMARLSTHMQTALSANGDQPAMRQYLALGYAFLDWAFENPTHFQVISARAVIDFEGSGIAAANNRIRDEMRRLLEAALAQGDIRNATVDDVLLATRALAYGLARMNVDGQMKSWDVEPGTALQVSRRLLDDCVGRFRLGA
ncbi:TetR/AcrR family transcriptional regulator [Andreprevotia chitinilytica]|uniref:TetR/AcrR family transcriptional regulator n=1 Tax=Andreprevotia chitinilytica TaxID=396808 RepID=UPI00068FEE49|nr:TetR/AcrR family transcriptional regulator [Andreprevotia chitinilytica]